MGDGKIHRPNEKLRQARERRASPSGSGRTMSRQELADAASVHLKQPLSGDYIAKLERGELRWPAKPTRGALRAVLGAREDHELGFFITRRAGSSPPEPRHVDGIELQPAKLANTIEPADSIASSRQDLAPSALRARCGADVAEWLDHVPTLLVTGGQNQGSEAIAAVLALSGAVDRSQPEAAALAFLVAGEVRESRSRQEARSLASSAPPIVVPQRRVSPQRLRGRSALLDHLEKTIAGDGSGRSPEQDSGVVVLHGIGGAGKTTVALEMAHRVHDRGLVTWWVTADEPGAMVAALYAVAFAAGANDVDFDHGHPADVLWRYLNAHPEPWLLVVDNADEPDKLGVGGRALADGTGWLRPPARPGAAVLVTSRDGRSKSWAPWIDLQPLPMLDPASAAHVLVDLAPRAGQLSDAQPLAEALGGLALALDLAGRYLAAAATDLLATSRTSSFETYLAALISGSAEAAMSTDDESIAGSDRPALFATWEMSLDLLNRQGHTLARPLLRLLAGFADAPLPHGVLRPEMLDHSQLFPNATPERLNTTIRALVELGLVILAKSSDQPSGLISMHPLVRMATRANTERSADAVAYRELSTNLLVAATDQLDPGNATDWPQWALLAPHCLAPLQGAFPRSRPTLGQRDLVPAARAAWYRYMAGLYQAAADDFLALSDLAELTLGPTHPDTLGARNNRARCVRETGDHGAAESDLRSLLDVARDSLPDDPVTVNIHINLARTIRELARSAEAEAEFRLILELARRTLGPDHPDTLVSWLNLAVALREQGQHVEAEDHYRGVLDAWRRKFPETDLTTLDLRYELAENVRQGGDPSTAEIEYRSILAIAEPVYGNDHPNTLIIRHGLANALREEGRLDAARDELVEILRRRRSRLGTQHPFTEATRRELQTLDGR